MLQLVLIMMAIIILFLYLKAKPQKPPLSGEINTRIESFRREMTGFLKEVKEAATQTKIRRLEIETGKFKKARQLDTILEKAAQEKDPRRAIDYYLEAFSFITKNNFKCLNIIMWNFNIVKLYFISHFIGVLCDRRVYRYLV